MNCMSALRLSIITLWVLRVKNKFPFIGLKEKDSYNRCEKRACEMGGVSVSEKQYKGTISTVKPQTSWAEMACAVSTVSRAAPHIRACLHSTALLQSLTAGKTSPLL